MKYIILREYFNSYSLMFTYKRSLILGKKDIKVPVLDEDVYYNTQYYSKRSPGLIQTYCQNYYLTNLIKSKLKDMTGYDFDNSINKFCLPFFEYGEGSFIKAHRGVQKELNLNKFQSLVAVLQLTQRGEDFNDGRFYINEKANCSSDGKTVTNDLKEDRFYPMLNKGDLIIFDNTQVIHGVETVTGKNAFRLTCSLRSN